ncbi:4507_t:CDS:2 [Racocetra fulgida]|uniref:4507_t:CDS:1 n=1 Tax=Racocetra fulgida TaxID=60492 RepID=A0A9N9G0R8_9GLOM|nr:4507_t:CDS:2 [Racocetra fulgida]
MYICDGKKGWKILGERASTEARFAGGFVLLGCADKVPVDFNVPVGLVPDDADAPVGLVDKTVGLGLLMFIVEEEEDVSPGCESECCEFESDLEDLLLGL